MINNHFKSDLQTSQNVWQLIKRKFSSQIILKTLFFWFSSWRCLCSWNLILDTLFKFRFFSAPGVLLYLQLHDFLAGKKEDINFFIFSKNTCCLVPLVFFSQTIWPLKQSTINVICRKILLREYVRDLLFTSSWSELHHEV